MSISLKLNRKVAGRLNLMGTRTIERGSVTVGRGEECTIALEDPKKHISRVHVELAEQEGEYWMMVVSKVNPVYVNGQRHTPGSRINVHSGDRIELGEYEIEILPQEEGEALNALRAMLQAPPAPEAKPTEKIEPSELESAAPAEIDFLLEPEEASPPAPAAPTPAPVTENAFAEATFLGKAPPPEEGLFDEPTMLHKSAQAPAEPEDKAFGEATFLGKSTPEADFFDEPTMLGRPTAPEKPAAPESPVALDKPATSEKPATLETLPEPEKPAVPVPEKGVFEEATFIGVKAEATYPQPAAAKPRYDPGMDRALKAFLDGAGLAQRELANAEEAEQFMRQCGTIVRAAVEGVMALLVARAEAKKEFRAEERTMVASRDNNPLKLMEDPKEAIDFLFDVKERGGGFLNPVQAVGDAFEDMRAHELALIAGMRAAIFGALRRFDPKTLENELEKAAGGLGLNRKAKLWDQFILYQQKLARDAEDDFNKVFGREFMGTYMAQVRQIRGEK